MTAGELRRILEDVDEDAEVRIAVQPSYPMSYAIGDVVDILEEGGVRVYLTEGGDGQYANRKIFE